MGDSFRLEIPDAREQVHAYTVQIFRRQPWSLDLHRDDTGSIYDVFEANGVWKCTCEDTTYKGHVKRDLPECKHLKAVREWIADQPKEDNPVTTAVATAPIHLAPHEQALLVGDLSKLTISERGVLYDKVCTSLGLNPYTRPFEYIVLQSKLTLYAKKDATEQLRKIHGVSITALERELVEGCWCITAHAKDASGRVDSSTGVVAIENLKGDAKANAMMKAETKAKRRVTLSICGLGLLDESEIESIPDAQPAEPAKPKQIETKRPTKPELPQTVEEFAERLRAMDSRLAAQGLCADGQLIRDVMSDQEVTKLSDIHISRIANAVDAAKQAAAEYMDAGIDRELKRTGADWGEVCDHHKIKRPGENLNRGQMAAIYKYLRNMETMERRGDPEQVAAEADYETV